MKQGLRARLDPVSQLSSTEPSPLGPGHGVPESFNPYCTGTSALSYCRGGTEAGWSQSWFTTHLRPGPQPGFKAHLLSKCLNKWINSLFSQNLISHGILGVTPGYERLPGSQVAFTYFNCILSPQLCGRPKADISLTWQISIIPILLMRKLWLGKVNNML